MGKIMLRFFIGKLRKRFLLANNILEEHRFGVPKAVPDDVKEGHFAVLAIKGSEKKRFVVKIECLNNPMFLRLLEQAEEEYGFEQTGALRVPCAPKELMNILQSCGNNYFMCS